MVCDDGIQMHYLSLASALGDGSSEFLSGRVSMKTDPSSSSLFTSMVPP